MSSAEPAPESRFDVADLSRRFGASLQRYLSRRGLRPEDVEDAAQDVFEKLARVADLENVSQIEGYLFKTASNVVIDYHRRATVRRSGDQIEYDDDLHAPEALSPERDLLARQELDRVIEALRELPERSRTVLILSRLEGFTHAEIARHLNISKSSVEKHMVKALAHLMRRLGRASH